MDPLVLLFLILIVVVSGLIGILADQLGRKLGKNRLTIWKLRPKHTARLGTALAGMATSTVTILLVFILSRDVRDWIVEGRAAIKKSQELRESNKQLEGTNFGLENQISGLSDQKKKLSATLMKDQANLTKVEADLKSASDRYLAAERRVKEASQRLAHTTAELKDTAAKLNKAGLRLTLVERDYSSLEASYKSMDKDLRGQYAEDQKLREQRAQLQRDNRDLTKSIDDLTKQSTELNKQLAADQAAQSQAQADLGQARSDLNTVKSELDRIRGMVAIEEAKLADSMQINNSARNQPLMFAQSEEMCRVQVPANTGRRKLETIVTALLREARLIAQRRGAGQSRATGEVAGFVSVRVDNRLLSPKDQEQAIIDGLVDQPHDVVLIAQSLFNSFKGEYVALTIQGYNDPLIYKKHQIVATARINGRLPREKVLSQFADFIQNGVVKNALAAGMIPPGGAASMVDVTPLETLTVVEQLIGAGRQMRVQAVVTKDTRAADTLDLEFLLK